MHKPSPLGLPDESSSSVSALVSSCKGLAPSRVLCTFVPLFIPGTHSTYKKLTVQWLNEALSFVSSFVVADSFVFRNRQLLVAAKRWRQAYGAVAALRQDNLQMDFLTLSDKQLICKESMRGGHQINIEF